MSALYVVHVIGSRLFRAMFAAFLAVWFGAVVPGHRRGIVQLPTAQCEGDCCSHTTHDSKSPPASAHCAICYFALTLSNPPTVIPELDRLTLIERLSPPMAMRSASLQVTIPYLGRAPPAANV